MVLRRPDFNQTFTLDEGQTLPRRLQASDTSNVVWTIDGGANAADFIISASGELQFKESSHLFPCLD